MDAFIDFSHIPLLTMDTRTGTRAFLVPVASVEEVSAVAPVVSAAVE